MNERLKPEDSKDEQILFFRSDCIGYACHVINVRIEKPEDSKQVN